MIKRADELTRRLLEKILGRGPQVKRGERSPSPRAIINRLQKKRDDILRFMTDLSVPFDNNGSERDLRMVKLIQKICGCFRTDDGARSFRRIGSYIARLTAKDVIDDDHAPHFTNAHLK